MTDEPTTNELPSLNLGTVCPRCDEPFKLRTLNVHDLALADRVGLTPQELVHRLEQDYLSQRLLCPSCTTTASN